MKTSGFSLFLNDTIYNILVEIVREKKEIVGMMAPSNFLLISKCFTFENIFLIFLSEA